MKIYRRTLAVSKHEIPLPRTRLPAVVDAIRGRDAMDDSTGVSKKNCRTRAAVREKRRDCGQHLRGGVGVDGANMLQREETSVSTPVITARNSSRKGTTSVLPATSGTPLQCVTSLHHAARDAGTKRIAVPSAPPRHTSAVVHGVRWLLEGNVLTT